jgi:ABC-type sugar transport system substrate-binding protein
MHMNKLGRIASAAMAIAIVAGCSSSTATTAPTAAPATAAPTTAASVAATPLHFCWMIFDTSIPFYTNLIKGANDQATKLGVKLDLVNGTAELTGQIAVVQQFITQKCDAILISSSDSKGIVPVVKQANEANIPVFAVNLGIGEGADVVTYIGVDDYQFGVQQGTLLMKALPTGGKVAYMNGKIGVDAQIQRKAGLMDTIKGHPEYEIIAEGTANWDSAAALALTQDWLSKYPKGSLNAIVDQGPEGATAAKYVSENGRTDVTYIVGDFPQTVKDGIKAGYIYGAPDQDPYPQGTGGIQAAYDWLTGNKSAVKQPKMLLDLPMITKDNVDQYPAAWNG